MSISSPQIILRRLGLRPEKARGQHFLLHPHQARRIVAALELTPADTVVEVGPGLGALTGCLAQEAGRVVAVEVDRNLAAYLQDERFVGEAHVEIVRLDVLKFDFQALSQEVGRPLAVVGNLPYQITSPLLFKLAAVKRAVSRAVLMMQEEVGARLTASPGGKDYGVLSVLMQYHFRLSRLFSLGPNNFFPPPQVNSLVMRLVVRDPEPVALDEPFFGQVVKAAFAARRKTLRNTLTAPTAALGLPPQDILAALAALDLDPGRRGETLSLAQFVRLANDLWTRRQKSRG